MVGQDFLNLFTQPSVGQSSTGFVAQQPNPYSNLPPYIIPQIPTAQSGSPFSMQNFLANLSESTGTMDGPQIDKQQLATGVQNIKDSKNQKLALMLFALGGALKGDKDFVQNTLALQQMQEGKKKQEAQKEAYQDFLKKYEGQIDQRITDFAKVLGPEKGSELLMGTFKGPRKLTAAEQNLETYNEIAKTGTPEEVELAQIALLGVRQGKSKEQLKNEVTASLLKATNPITGEPYEMEEIQERLSIFDKFYQNSKPSNATQSVPLQIEGYTILEG